MIYGYARTSTYKQKHENTIKVQVSSLKKYLENHHTSVHQHIYKDSGVSGKTMNRPALNKLISIIKPHDTLVVYKLDRIGRTFMGTLDFIDKLSDKGINVVILTPHEMKINNTPMGKFIQRALMNVASFERDLIIDRMNAGRAYAKARAKEYHLSNKTWKGGRPSWISNPAIKKHYFGIYQYFKKHTGKQVSAFFNIPVRTAYYAREQVSKYLKQNNRK